MAFAHGQKGERMSDLISRQDAIDEIREVYEYEFPTASGEFDKFATVIIPNLLRNLPSVEPERKKGNWIVKEEDWRKQLEWDECSECGFTTTKQYNFCPNCGADMW